MSQNVVDYSLNPTGPELLDDYLDKEQKNNLTSNSGIQRPSYAQAGTLWVDNSATPWTWYFYDGTSDIAVGTFNPSTHEFISANFANVVNLTTAQSIAGIKTFTDKPRVPTPTSTDNVATVTNRSYVDAIKTNLESSISALQTEITTSITNLKQALYPVGSIYANTSNTNPNTILGFGTWSKLDSTLVTKLANDAPVYGNGKSLGLSDGTNIGGLKGIYAGNTFPLIGQTTAYNKNVGTSNTSNTSFGQDKTVGVVTSGESGLKCDTSNLATKITVYLWERTA